MDLNKAIQQHAEMEDFFSGGFAAKDPEIARRKIEREKRAEQAKIELEKLNES